MEKKNWDFSHKTKELGVHANALISLHLKKPDEFDKEWLFNKLIEQYEILELDMEMDAD